jgi:hypothetical protein
MWVEPSKKGVQKAENRWFVPIVKKPLLCLFINIHTAGDFIPHHSTTNPQLLENIEHITEGERMALYPVNA